MEADKKYIDMDGTEWGQESSAVVSMCNEELGVWRWVGEGL